MSNMTEEVKQEVKVEVKEEVKEEVQLSDTENQAYKEGWRPEDEFTGDKVKWIPADEFMRRKPLFEKIDSLKSETYHTRKELQDVKKTLTTLAEHHKKVRQTEYQNALVELKAERRIALEERDGAAIERVEDRMDELKQEKQEFDRQVQAEQKQVTVNPSPEFVGWVKDNSWYHTNKEMHDFADSIGATYLKNNPHVTPDDVFSHVTKQTKKAYPDEFSPEQKSSRKPSPVDSGDSESRPSSHKKDDYKMSAEETEVARRFEQAGIMSQKEYAAELKKIAKRS